MLVSQVTFIYSSCVDEVTLFKDYPGQFAPL